jgi:hypothetical protein
VPFLVSPCCRSGNGEIPGADPGARLGSRKGHPWGKGLPQPGLGEQPTSIYPVILIPGLECSAPLIAT